ncbi:hypothetical protein KJ781_03060 [Patescibacteria group bacterium]|nr:hypothetical protein [Patescibacteria group bacterium]MBU1448591.1 hypothetical protein [Patescibacteria group bacterium]MBU2613271.1 hypothetical protein [Patescibacteria group bacterium]
MSGSAPSERRRIPTVYVILSTTGSRKPEKLVEMYVDIVRRLRLRTPKGEVLYELWLDRFKVPRGILTVFPPVVNDERHALQVLFDGGDVENGHCTFRAFTPTADHACRYFLRHGGRPEDLIEGERGDIVVDVP